jgi:hypothetical protein
VATDRQKESRMSKTEKTPVPMTAAQTKVVEQIKTDATRLGLELAAFPDHYDWYDQYATINPAEEWKKAQAAIKLLATIAPAAGLLNDAVWPVIKAAYEAVEKPFEAIKNLESFRTNVVNEAFRIDRWIETEGKKVTDAIALRGAELPSDPWADEEKEMRSQF